MLVAVAIFALASALAYGGLAAITRARTQLDAQNERLGRLQFAIGLVERDLRSAAPRAIRDGYGAPLLAVTGTRERIELSRYGFANALALPRAEIERVGYRVQDKRLQRLRYAVLDRTPGSVPQVDDLLDRVDAIEFDYFDADGRELPQWPSPRPTSATTPRAVAITLTLSDYGSIRRVLELPEPARP
jgi:general secretion pathway protein J